MEGVRFFLLAGTIAAGLAPVSVPANTTDKHNFGPTSKIQNRPFKDL